MEKYIFLDFNGTVLDDVDLCLNLLNEMLSAKEGKTVNLEEYKNIFDFPIVKYYERAGFRYANYTFEELADYFIIEYSKRNPTQSKIFDDLESSVNALKEIGYKVVICSASMKNLLIEQLKGFNIYQLFDDVIALDNYYAASKLELAKAYVSNVDVDLDNSYFIGDTTHDAEVGNACGLKVILVERGHQSKEVLQKANCTILDTLKGASEYIKTSIIDK